MDIEGLKSSAAGRWFGIFDVLGIPTRQDHKHSPCPICGGKDRFRLDADGSGYFCNGCGAGDAIGLIQKVKGVDFVEAVKQVSGVLGDIPESAPPKKTADPRKRLNKLWKDATSLDGKTPVEKYLRSRGILIAAPEIKSHPACWEPDTKNKYPAMLARVVAPDGKPLSIHRTYLGNGGKADVPSPKKLMPGVAPLAGGAVRLGAPRDGFVAVAEGVESALSVMQMYNIPCWAVLGTSLMRSFEPPDGIRHVGIYGDADNNYAGQSAAYTLAHKLAARDLLVEVVFPACEGDWNDLLQEKK